MRATLLQLVPFLFAGGALAVHCVVDESSVTLLCDGAHPCPDGQSCGEEGICIAPINADLGMVDQATPPADLRAAPVVGCSGSGGKQIGQAVACPGAFVEGQAASLCDAAKGYHICKVADLSKIDSVAADQLTGFYIVEVPGYYLMMSSRDSPTCGSSAVGSPVWFGFGGLSSSLVHEHPATKCSGIDRSVDCSQSGGAWFCKAIGDMTRVENKTATDGVACCK